jgi:hypothetical protein
MEDLDLIAEVADGPLLIEQLPEGSSTSLATTIASVVATTISTTIATHFCATDCSGTAATLVCGPCSASLAG